MKPPAPIIALASGWLAVDKPSGWSVHNQPGKDLCSKFAQFLRQDHRHRRKVGFDPEFGLHPAHRLDKETSGVILLSCHQDTLRYFSNAFGSNLVTKHYLALVHGNIGRHDHWDEWSWPLTPRAAGRRHIQGKGTRVACQTRFRLIRHSPRYSLLKCRLVTGRTHQIRRHAALSGHPILGDRRYGSHRACRYLEKRHEFKRLALHCAGLKIELPGCHNARWVESPILPESIQQVLGADEG